MKATDLRTLGRTGVELTQLGQGTAPLGDLFVTLDEVQATQVIDEAWSAGVRFYDTAPWYGLGQSEHRCGRALYRRPRHEFVLSTKVGRYLTAPAPGRTPAPTIWKSGAPFNVVFDYSYDGVMRSVEQSMQRLGLSRIDLLLIHDLDFAYHGTEASVAAYLGQLKTGGARALAALREQGVIRGFGAGINERGMIARLLGLLDIDFFLVAMPYTLLDQAILDDEFALCEQRGVGLIIGAVLASGILGTGARPGATYNYAPAPPEIMAKTERIEAVCKRHGVPLAAAALQFPLGHPLVASVIPGALSAAHVQQNVHSLQTPIPAALWDELRAEGLLHPRAPVPAARDAVAAAATAR
jgi:D-threo-aldose 1-dehydrogenase